MSDKIPTFEDVAALRTIVPAIAHALPHEDRIGREAVLCAMVIALADQNVQMLNDAIKWHERHMMPVLIAMRDAP